MTSRPDRPTHGEPSSTRRDRLGWPRVTARMLLIVLPGQLIGSFVASMALPLSVLGDRPELAVLMGVLPGLVAGIGIGLLLHPDRDQLLGYALVGAAVAVASLLLLSGLGRLRGPESIPSAPLVNHLRGLLIAAVVQSAAAVPLWLLRRRRWV